MPINSFKVCVLLLLLIVAFSTQAQEIKMDSIVVPSLAYNNRQESITFKSIGKKLFIKPTQNFFFIYFHSLQKHTTYEYRLVGLETYLIQTNNNYAYYSNIPEGEYIFLVKEKNSSQSLSLNIHVQGPFWQQWWFAPIVFLFVLGMISIVLYFFFLYRSRQQLHIQSVRHELEIKALRAQMNPHFIFNSMNTIDAYILRKRFVEASDCLQKFSKLIRQILENSENQTITIAKEIETLRLYIELEQERFSHSFDYELAIEPLLLEENYQIPPLLLQPFVENAILHGIRHLTERHGKILINLCIVDGLLLCVIEDNGIGREASSEINQQRQDGHQSMGVDITMERIKSYQALYGKQMETSITDLKVGTKVEIKLPLSTSNP